MPDQSITNPLGVYGSTIADYTTGKDSAGGEIAYGKSFRPYRCAGTITRGSVVCLLAPADALTPLSVTPKVTAQFFSSVIGIADKSGVAGDVIPVITEGIAFADVGAGTPVVNQTATVQANSNQVGIGGTTADATTIAGSVLGVFLSGAKDASNLTPVFVNRQ